MHSITTRLWPSSWGRQVAHINLCVLPAGAPRTRPAGLRPEPAVSEGGADVCVSVGGAEGRPARFFVSGRRIAACGATPSFARQSANRWTLWSHPQVWE